MPQPPPEPGEAEWRHAHRLGFRPRTAGIELGVRFAVLALVLGAVSWDGLVGAMRSALMEAASAPRAELGPMIERACAVSAALCVLALASAVSASLVLGRLGPRGKDAAHKGRAPGRPAGSVVRWMVTLLALCVTAYALRGVVAGGARAVVATDAGLLALWGAWARRVPSVLAFVMIGLGLLELLDARARTREAYLRYRETRAQRSGARR